MGMGRGTRDTAGTWECGVRVGMRETPREARMEIRLEGLGAVRNTLVPSHLSRGLTLLLFFLFLAARLVGFQFPNQGSIGSQLGSPAEPPALQAWSLNH